MHAELIIQAFSACASWRSSGTRPARTPARSAAGRAGRGWDRSPWTRGSGEPAGDADREPLVEQLVGHHEPVDDTRGDDGEPDRECGPHSSRTGSEEDATPRARAPMRLETGRPATATSGARAPDDPIAPRHERSRTRGRRKVTVRVENYGLDVAAMKLIERRISALQRDPLSVRNAVGVIVTSTAAVVEKNPSTESTMSGPARLHSPDRRPRHFPGTWG